MSRYFRLSFPIVAILGILLFIYQTGTPIALLSRGEFGGVSLRIEYATTSEAWEKGLSGRESIAPDYGMLFVFPNDDYYGFWMKDMRVPLDIFWLDSDGHVVFFIKDVATSTYPNVFYPSAPAQYVLETVAGFAQTHNIGIGAPLILKNPPNVSK